MKEAFEILKTHFGWDEESALKFFDAPNGSLGGITPRKYFQDHGEERFDHWVLMQSDPVKEKLQKKK